MKKMMYVFAILCTVLVLSGCAMKDSAMDYDYLGDEYGEEDTTPEEPAPTTTV